MRKCLLLLALLLLISASLLAQGNRTPRQLIFKCASPIDVKSDRTGLAAFDSYLNQLGAHSVQPVKGMHKPLYYLASLTVEPDWDALREGKLKFAGIEYVQPNYLNSMHIVPNDPYYYQQFHQVTSNPQAWNYTTGSQQVIVGVVDSGCLVEHPDLAANIYVNEDEIPDNGIDDDGNGYIDDIYGWDFTDAPELSDTAIGDYLDQDNDVDDENFHGTHVAGIIGAVGNNGIGVAGVAWNIKLMPIRAGFRTTAGQGTLQDDDAAAALIYAADNGCNVVNMSWGDPFYSPIIGDACEYAYSKGVTLVASAGNDPGPFLSYPAKLSSVISVGAVNKSRNIAGFSSYGIDMDLVAPGELVWSTYKLEEDQLYYEQSGTSMSAPIVVGAVALLLSLHPGLDPDEVRARLLTATDDLGAAGVDMYYGHGLLNTKKLLENTNPPLIYIDQPEDQSGVTESVDITGTVMGEDMFQYSVMYSTKPNPTSLDWKDINTHSNQPEFHRQPVQDGVIATFYIPELFPEGEYRLRIEYTNQTGGKYYYYRTVIHDSSAPEIRNGTLQGFSRYDKQNIRHYISAIFSEPVRTELKITASDANTYLCYGTQLDSLHVWAIPAYIPEGEIAIQYKATNVCGLSLVSNPIPAFMNIEYVSVPTVGLTWQSIGQARVALNATYDYNNDSYPEYLAMDLPTTGYGNVFAYQPQAGGHVVTHPFNDTFWLLGIGNTNATGQEILQLKSDTAVLLESQAGNQYPNLAVWEQPSITGGTIVDYSGDGVQDLLLVKNLPLERVVQAYKRTGGQDIFAEKNTLHNTSDTSLRNTFVPTITVRNFDNDPYKDILVADTDGDVMVFEIMNDNLETLSWTTRLPVGNTYSITSGDFDGNGRQDFMIGGYYRDVLDSNQNFWYFEGFRNNQNNSYVSMGSIMFNEVISQNAIQSMDLDSDGKDEVILAIAPNLFILDYVDGEFKPVFNGKSFRTYGILTYKDANNRPYFLTNYEVEPDSVIAVEWTTEDPFTGPPTPANFLALPQNHQSVRLSWVPNGADHYRVYRRVDAGTPELIDNLTGNSWLDTGLVTGQTYEYRVTAVMNSLDPPESAPSLWVPATPDSLPNVRLVAMVSPNELQVFFDRPMSSTILNPSLFKVSHGMVNPTSINSIDGGKGVHMHFNKAFPEIAEDFYLAMYNLYTDKGLRLDSLTCEFPYLQDTEEPRVEEVTVTGDRRTVVIRMNETIASGNPNPEHLLNFELTCPSNDADNSIESVTHAGAELRVSFATQLKFSGSAYYIRIRNIKDLAGNTVSKQYNVARFSLSNIKNLKDVTAYPNPVLAAQQPWCRFINFPSGKGGRIKIFNSAGNLVFNNAIGPFNSEVNDISWTWNLANNEGEKVSSGVYYWVIEMGGDVARGKVAIIR